MKKTTLLHSELSRVIAEMGHGDLLVIGDAGLPVPKGVLRIDLAVTANVPRFEEVLASVLRELQVETAWVASESDPTWRDRLVDRHRSLPASLSLESHADFKTRSANAVAVVRTGEMTPYTNIGLVSGVVF
ncbi:MAG: D-ribose pyranase [Pseudomonadota bacterium]